jgi:MtN3 and saliva related transmembrane protein
LTIIDALGLLAGGMTTAAFIPQLLKLHASKSGEDLSLVMMMVFSAGVFLWLVYGLMIASLPLIIANVVTLMLSLAILLLKIHYARRRAAARGPEPS